MKRRFEFRLRRVARVRAIEERLAREERAAAELAARAAEKAREDAREALQAARLQLARGLAGTVDPRLVISAHRLVDDHQRRLGERTGRAAGERRLADAAAEVHRERKAAAQAMERLEERAAARHREALTREENSQMDEVASQRARRCAAPALRREKGETPSSSAPAAADHPPVPSPDRAP